MEASVMAVKTQNSGKNMYNKNGFKKKDAEKKEDRFCEYCKVQGHLKENCFKLNGYPDWYVELLKIKKEKKMGRQINMADTITDQEKSGSSKHQDWMVDLIKQEVTKALKGTQLTKEGGSNVNFILTTEYAGMVNFPKSKPDLKESWIVDTGASSHICINHKSFIVLNALEAPIFVNLPNGTVIKVTESGTVFFNGLKLLDTLFIPDFTHNLLSVNKLTLTNPVYSIFFPNFCLLQE